MRRIQIDSPKSKDNIIETIYLIFVKENTLHLSKPRLTGSEYGHSEGCDAIAYSRVPLAMVLNWPYQTDDSVVVITFAA